MIKHLPVLVLIVASMSCRDWGWPDVQPQPFDATVWHDFTADHLTFSGPQPRLAMIDDLRARHLKTGIPRADVVSLLGPPDFRPAGEASPESKIDEYLVGASISDPITFDCDYDEHGKLVRTQIREH